MLSCPKETSKDRLNKRGNIKIEPSEDFKNYFMFLQAMAEQVPDHEGAKPQIINKEMSVVSVEKQTNIDHIISGQSFRV